jgi:hypothetical protein
MGGPPACALPLVEVGVGRSCTPSCSCMPGTGSDAGQGLAGRDYFSDHPPPADWEIIFADTGESAMTGAGCGAWLLPDAIVHADLRGCGQARPGALLAFHRQHGQFGP